MEPGAGRQEKEQQDRIQEQEGAPAPVRRRQRVIINGEASKWHEVTASIIQGSVLGPTLAKCFSNSSHQGRNLTPEDKPLVSKLADGEKRGRVVKNEEQGKRMQEDMKHCQVEVQKEYFWTSFSNHREIS